MLHAANVIYFLIMNNGLKKQIQWRNFQLILKYIIYLTMLMIMFL